MNVTLYGYVGNRHIRIGSLHLAGDKIVMDVNPGYPNQARARSLLTAVATNPVRYGDRVTTPDTPEAFLHVLQAQYDGAYFYVTAPTDIVQKYTGVWDETDSDEMIPGNFERVLRDGPPDEPRDEIGRWTTGGAGAGLSPTQTAILAHVKEHGGKLVRKPGGFWHAEGSPMDAKGIPEKWVGASTVHALERKGVLERTHEFPEAWRDSRRLVEPKTAWTKPTAEDFITARDKNPRPDFFSHLEPGDLADHKLIMNKDGTAGAAVAPDGDVQNIFRNPGAPKGAGSAALKEAVKQGGMMLDAYDYETPGQPGLPDIYRKAGFVETGRMKFNPVFRPHWPADRKPDVVFMAYVGGDQSGSPKATNYYASHEWNNAKAYSTEVAKEAADKTIGRANFMAAKPGRGVSGTSAAWKTHKVTVQAGEYPESNTEVTQHITHDGQFTITPSGGMKYVPAHGIRGVAYNHWVWSGYRLTDLRPDRPEWENETQRFTTVAGAKKAAEHRLRRASTKKAELSGADAESEKINENKKEWGNKVHLFRAAEWTHKNGHPRCIRCGDEESVDGLCMPDLIKYARMLDKAFSGRIETPDMAKWVTQFHKQCIEKGESCAVAWPVCPVGKEEIAKYITSSKGKFLVHAESGKVLGTHGSRGEAEAQLRAIEANKHSKEKAEIEKAWTDAARAASIAARSKGWKGESHAPAIGEEGSSHPQTLFTHPDHPGHRITISHEDEGVWHHYTPGPGGSAKGSSQESSNVGVVPLSTHLDEFHGTKKVVGEKAPNQKSIDALQAAFMEFAKAAGIVIKREDVLCEQVENDDDGAVYKIEYSGGREFFKESGGQAVRLAVYTQKSGLHPIAKAEMQRYTLGAVYAPGETDYHGDTMTELELEKAAWAYAQKDGMTARVGLMHKDGTAGSGKVVESYLYRGPVWKLKDAAGRDQTITPGTWMLGVVWEPEAWAKVMDKSVTGYSLQGVARKFSGDKEI